MKKKVYQKLDDQLFVVRKPLNGDTEEEIVRYSLMSSIVLGLDLSMFNPIDKYDYMQVYLIYEGMRLGVDVRHYRNPDKFDRAQMYMMLFGLTNHIDIGEYGDPSKYTWRQMAAVLCGRFHYVEAELYNDPEKYTEQEMIDAFFARYNLLYGKDEWTMDIGNLYWIERSNGDVGDGALVENDSN